ncbi:hypothetical protein FCIRC_1106 [Fusarium circinatum]|uniref:Uncharacterized protein n=1 Tax=Fusarium circinatum TaxID=48490 RepID=A0A8H5XBT9_FUSCI|nr:hypothetical protein FCIRC_1106 [Fusarium circinatum]
MSMDMPIYWGDMADLDFEPNRLDYFTLFDPDLDIQLLADKRTIERWSQCLKRFRQDPGKHRNISYIVGDVFDTLREGQAINSIAFTRALSRMQASSKSVPKAQMNMRQEIELMSYDTDMGNDPGKKQVGEVQRRLQKLNKEVMKGGVV